MAEGSASPVLLPPCGFLPLDTEQTDRKWDQSEGVSLHITEEELENSTALSCGSTAPYNPPALPELYDKKKNPRALPELYDKKKNPPALPELYDKKKNPPALPELYDKKKNPPALPELKNSAQSLTLSTTLVAVGSMDTRSRMTRANGQPPVTDDVITGCRSAEQENSEPDEWI
ncbi:unnamed protein product [Arctogadus glacialis]